MNTDKLLKAAMALACCGLAWAIWDTTRDRVIQVGDTAPEFTIKTDSGKTLTRSDFGGKILVLNFWATWCAPCVTETPAFESIHRDLRDKGLVMVGVSIDKKEEKYKNFLKRFNVSYLTSRDPEAALPDSFGTYRVPETYVIDKSGKVVQKLIGLNWKPDELSRYLRSLL